MADFDNGILKVPQKRDKKLIIIIIMIFTVMIGSIMYVGIDALVKVKNYKLIAYNTTDENSEQDHEDSEETYDNPNDHVTENENNYEAIEDGAGIYTEEIYEYDLDSNNDYVIEFEENINYNVDYSVDWDFYSDTSVNGYAYLTDSYYILSGDIPNIDYLNNQIYLMCTDINEQYRSLFDDLTYQINMSLNGTAYVTYNDNNMISIISIQQYSAEGNNFFVELRSMNIDLDKGEVINHYDLFHPDKGFTTRFREQSLIQNGDVDTLNALTEEDLINLLTNEATCICFFTDKGLEVGIINQGYLTITINDYEKYISNTYH